MGTDVSEGPNAIIICRSACKVMKRRLCCEITSSFHLWSALPSVRPRVTTRPPNGRIFTKFDIWVFFENLSKIH